MRIDPWKQVPLKRIGSQLIVNYANPFGYLIE